MEVLSAEQMKKHFLSHNKMRECSGHQAKVHTVDWNCDGKRLGSGSFDKTVCIYSLERDRLAKEYTFRGHGDTVDQLRWHPSHADVFGTASGDKTVRIWDARSSKPASSISTKGENINMAWHPDGRTIAVGNKEDLVSFIDVRKAQIRADEQFKFEVNEFGWSRPGDLFFLTSGQGSIHILSYPELVPQHMLHAHPANCICIAFDPTGKYFATGSNDALASIWDIREFACTRTLSRLEWPVRAVAFSFDGQLLASASEDLFIDISHVQTGEKVAEAPCESPTFTIAWHPRRHVIAYACDDKDKASYGGGDRDRGSVKIYGISSDA